MEVTTALPPAGRTVVMKAGDHNEPRHSHLLLQDLREMYAKVVLGQEGHLQKLVTHVPCSE